VNAFVGNNPTGALITSGLPVTREQPTEHAEIAFAEFTFASPLLQGEAIFYLNLMTVPFARPFRTISTLEVG